jgi:riboflavin kinase/FMN adenylyltransferase
MNIGLRPTFNGEKRTLEVNIIDGTGNLYGKTVTVRFCVRLRDEQQFPSADALARQIEKDKEEAEELLANYKM